MTRIMCLKINMGLELATCNQPGRLATSQCSKLAYAYCTEDGIKSPRHIKTVLG